MTGLRVAASLALAALLAGCGQQAEQGSPAAEPRAPTSPAASAAPACPAVAAAPVPAPAHGLPATRLRCLGPGPSVRLSDLRGTPTVLNFWAAWCGECREEMPYFRAAMARAGDRVRFLGVHAWAERAFGLQSIHDFQVPFPSLDGGDGNEVPQSVQVVAPPTTLFVDARGQVVGRQVGVIQSEAQLEELIHRYLGVPL